jgi:4,5-DOPA dioxygenase extradiol
MLPSFFVSHGAPTLPLSDAPAKTFLEGLGARIDAEHGRPRAIVVVSAHWETATPMVNLVTTNDTIHDFFGFPAALYDMKYPAPGAASVAKRVVDLLGAAGLPTGTDTSRGLDHGAWVPLKLMYPAADIPVVQLSIQSHLGPDHHLRVGRALAPLRAEGVLILASGSFTHDLSEFRTYRNALNAPEPSWVSGFASWFSAALTSLNLDDLLAYRARAPYAVKNHPTDEHLLPIYVALGAAGTEPVAHHIHESATFVILRMDVWEFESKADAEKLAA